MEIMNNIVIYIIILILYVISIYGCKKYNHKIYSKGGINEGRKRMFFDKVMIIIPIINTILTVEWLLGNTKYKNKIFTIILLLCNTFLYSQPLPTNNGHHNGWHNGHNHHGAAIDNTWIFLLIIACVVFVIYKFKKKK